MVKTNISQGNVVTCFLSAVGSLLVTLLQFTADSSGAEILKNRYKISRHTDKWTKVCMGVFLECSV